MNLELSEKILTPRILPFNSAALNLIAPVMVSPQEAEDSAQEVFSKIANNLKGFEDWAKLSTWIYRIATNTTLDRAGALACGRKLPDKS